jgi:DNA-directed RNA polymerase subunit RPC12/RpoP
MGSGDIHSAAIKCACGHRVVRKDVLQTGLYLSVLGPSYIYVRYRCGRCKRVGEKLVEQEAWDPSVLRADRRSNRPGLSKAEIRRFAKMGEITADEIIDFHYALDGLSAELEEEVESA